MRNIEFNRITCAHRSALTNDQASQPAHICNIQEDEWFIYRHLHCHHYTRWYINTYTYSNTQNTRNHTTVDHMLHYHSYGHQVSSPAGEENARDDVQNLVLSMVCMSLARHRRYATEDLPSASSEYSGTHRAESPLTTTLSR